MLINGLTRFAFFFLFSRSGLQYCKWANLHEDQNEVYLVIYNETHLVTFKLLRLIALHIKGTYTFSFFAVFWQFDCFNSKINADIFCETIPVEFSFQKVVAFLRCNAEKLEWLCDVHAGRIIHNKLEDTFCKTLLTETLPRFNCFILITPYLFDNYINPK